MEANIDFSVLARRVAERGPRHIAVVCGTDNCTRAAAARAEAEGVAVPIFTDDPREAVAMCRSGKADAILKGMLPTAELLHAVLDKQCGLLPRGAVLTHLAVLQMPQLGRLLMVSDAAVIPNPTLEQRLAIVGYMAEAGHRLGIACPKIALTHCNEDTSEKFPITLDYREIVARGAEGALLDGPMDVACALSAAAAAKKHIAGPVAGCADGIVLPDIEAGNTFYKTATLLAGAVPAGTLRGTTHPVALSSRGDTEEAKYASIVLAATLAEDSKN